MKCEISRLNAIKAKRIGIICDAADILLQNIPNRIPLTEDMIAAAILDPSIQHLPVIDDWLRKQRKTRTEMLQNVIKTYNINICSESEVMQSTQNQQQTQQHVDARLFLLQKYSAVTRNSSSLDTEVNRFNSVKEEVSDVLGFWRAQECNYPRLAQVARVILCKPATSAKSESAFSVAGALISKKRANIDPLRAQKVLFIHDNYNLLKCNEL